MSKNNTKKKKQPGVTLTAKQKRDIRYTAREHLRYFSVNRRVRNCGTPMGDVGLRVSTLPDGTRHGGFAGLETCGSQVCPVCAAKIAHHRQQEIEKAVKGHLALNGSVVMLTLTMRHHKGQTLQELWDGMSAAWKAATNGSGWKADRESFGVEHYVRVVETTYGSKGWHVHVHALLLGDDKLKDPMVRTDLATRMFNRWATKLTGLGFAAPLYAKGGADIRYIEPTEEVAGVIADYVSKSGMGSELITAAVDSDHRMHDVLAASEKDQTHAKEQALKALDKAKSLSFEIARADLKQGRRGNRTPWQILLDFIDNGLANDLERWNEYEKVSKGRRTITWSRGLRDTYSLGKEQTDEEIAAQEFDGELEAVMPGAVYRAGCKRTPRFPALVLNALEAEGKDGVDCLLSSMGLPLTQLTGAVAYTPPEFKLTGQKREHYRDKVMVEIEG